MNLDQSQRIAESLAACAARLDSVLVPWGFAFESDRVNPSHTGVYASGHFVRGMTRIGVSCRDTIDNVFYEHSFVIYQNSWLCEIERFDIHHGDLMSSLGHAADCWLARPYVGMCSPLVPRNGADIVTALIHDLEIIAAPVLRKPCEQFFDIVRTGRRSFFVKNIPQAF
jgi:hypothetical protein